MATEKKYLDLQGLQHLKDQKVLVKHPDKTNATPDAVTVGHDANGHVILGGKILPSDIGAAASSDIKDGKLTIQANGTSKGTFTANQASDTTINITAADLGLASALSFAGTTLTALTDGATTNPIKIKQSSTDTTGTDYNAISGNVVLYNNKEFIWNGSAWEELGDESSHALKSITINGDGTYITGGGNLSSNRTLSHKSYTAVTEAPVKVGRDAGGHVVLGGRLSTADDGIHKHTITASVPASSFLTSASGTTTKISLNKETDTFIKSYPGATSNLETTTITGTNGTVTASKAKAGTKVDVAKAGTAVVYGKANVGSAKTVATRASSPTTVGNANVGAEISILGIDDSTTATASKAKAGTAVNVATTGTAVTVATRATSQTTVGNANVGTEVSATAYNADTPAYTASYVEADECLTFTALGSISFNPAASSSTKIYGCGDTTDITPAKANGTITPYTFDEVTVPVAAKAATAFTPAAASSTTIYGCGDTTSITPAVAAPNTQTIIPAVSNGTITPYTFDDVVAAKKADSAITVATGDLATDASGAAVMIGLGTADTGPALKSATIQSGTTGDVTVVYKVSSAKNTDAVSITASSSDAGSHNHEVQ